MGRDARETRASLADGGYSCMRARLTKEEGSQGATEEGLQLRELERRLG